MNEIKCRAWDKEGKLMIEHDAFDGLIPIGDKDLIFMLFTGLKDKNGKEIYRDDILTDGILVVWVERFASFGLRKSGWVFTHFFGEALDPVNNEVIGNLHENPELFEVRS